MREHSSPSAKSCRSVRSTASSPGRRPDLLRMVQQPAALSYAATPAVAQAATDLGPRSDTISHTSAAQYTSSQAERSLQASLQHDRRHKWQPPDELEPMPAAHVMPESKEVRHVCFDERALCRQQAQRKWHYEARIAKRPSAQSHTQKRHHMDVFIQQLQSQIECASSLWSSFLPQEAAPNQSRMARAAVAMPQPPPRTWSGAPSWRWVWHVSMELHAPLLTPSLHLRRGVSGQLRGRASSIVACALRSQVDRDASPHANVILRWYPSYVLRAMLRLLSYTPSDDRLLWAVSQPRRISYVVPLTSSFSTMLPPLTEAMVTTCLELALVFTQLYLTILLAIVQRWLSIFHFFLQ